MTHYLLTMLYLRPRAVFLPRKAKIHGTVERTILLRPTRRRGFARSFSIYRKEVIEGKLLGQMEQYRFI